MFVNSIGLQFLKHLEENDAFGADGTARATRSTELVTKFQSWRLKENDLGTWAEPDVLALFSPLLNTDRKSVRVAGKVRKVRVATAFKDEAVAFIESLEGTEDDADDDPRLPWWRTDAVRRRRWHAARSSTDVGRDRRAWRW